MSSSSFEFQIHRAVAFNNEGIDFLRRGNYGEAASALSTSLKATKAAIMRASDVAARDLKSFASPQSPLETETIGLDLLPSGSPVHAVCYKIILCPTSSRVVPFEHQEDNEMRSIAAVVIYNLGILYHIKGLFFSGEKAEDSFQKALQMFEHSYSLQGLERFCTYEANVALRAMSTLNNLAELHTLLHNEQYASQCWQYLLSLIIYFGEYGLLKEEADYSGMGRRGSQVQHFLSNVIKLILKGKCTAPAA
jgi:hypothetical protein